MSSKQNFVFESLRHISVPLSKNLCFASSQWAKRLFVDVKILAKVFKPIGSPKENFLGYPAEEEREWSDEEIDAHWKDWRG